MPKNAEEKENSHLRGALSETMGFCLRMARKYPVEDVGLILSVVSFALNPSDGGKSGFSEAETLELAKGDWMSFLDNLDSAEEFRKSRCPCGGSRETLTPAGRRCADCGKIE